MQSLITEEVMKYVKKRSEAMLGQYQLTHEDIEDIESEIYLELVSKANENFESKSCYLGFVGKVATLKIREIIRKRKVSRKDYRKCQKYLSDTVEEIDGNSVEYGDTISSDQIGLEQGRKNYSSQTLEVVSIDLKNAINTLPSEELKEIVRLLPVYSRTEVAERLGITRRTLRRRMETIKNHFSKKGISQLF